MVMRWCGSAFLHRRCQRVRSTLSLSPPVMLQSARRLGLRHLSRTNKQQSITSRRTNLRLYVFRISIRSTTFLCSSNGKIEHRLIEGRSVALASSSCNQFPMSCVFVSEVTPRPFTRIGVPMRATTSCFPTTVVVRARTGILFPSRGWRQPRSMRLCIVHFFVRFSRCGNSLICNAEKILNL